MDGYPKKIGEQWGGLPSDLSAAFVWNRNGKTYFIKGMLTINTITTKT